ncbi:PREDICTED: alpha-N-acetylgalactosaminide alpha-2,6-sialyltransferase 2-like [Poecilia mexicana]|uniref:alpha-N-acetylgalactosaminide alpha-2,6-sialyltransferase 2-like n=1 Tax=Poecilia mexicana TaxID=48701 RepID=UPI00072E906B|nr:PREDICTED: alpha-N-acetylgalactosaminide alpha-2,6-sialyltransferase 2-like [Poecilia mexicana]
MKKVLLPRRLAAELQQAEAPPSLRAVMRNDPVLQSRFSFSLPVLQWAGSWSRSSWTQLKDRAPPYSWKGLPVSGRPFQPFSPGSHLLQVFKRSETSIHFLTPCPLVGSRGAAASPANMSGGPDFTCRCLPSSSSSSPVLQASLPLLNSSRLFQRDSPGRCVRCAVVGNGGILRGAGQGRNIDGHDLVFRPWKYFGHKPPESFRMLHPQFISYLMHSLLTSPLMTDSLARDLYMPSTDAADGLTHLWRTDLAASEPVCVLQVSAYGFITRNYADFSDHYYDSVPRPLRFFANHDLQMEGGLWEALHRRGVLRLFQRGRGRGKVTGSGREGV